LKRRSLMMPMDMVDRLSTITRFAPSAMTRSLACVSHFAPKSSTGTV
jgi:hypothetical protein